MMGTRADFYSGGTDPETMVWLGSIAWDGYPSGIDKAVLQATALDDYLIALIEFFDRDDFTPPELGWPWPWDDSATTDYAYTFVEGVGVLASAFGHAWHDPNIVLPREEGEDEDDYYERVAEYDYREDDTVRFPDMSTIKNVDFGQRSGLIVIST